jgi:fructokinase
MTPLPLYGGIEAGGTKFVCALGTGPDHLLEEQVFPTTTPAETLTRTVRFFQAQPRLPEAIGIGSFGPLDLNPDSSTFGYITTTPKSGWANTDFAGAIERALGVRVAIDTDVNAAAAGEHRWGAARGLDTFIYLTVGTGIGGGGFARGRRLRGLVHPEMGHVAVPRARGDDFAGICPFHGPCIEGMASGPAIEKRWGAPGHALPPDHPAWALQAHYLAYALASYIYVLSPQRLILGGGVMQQPHLFPLLRRKVQDVLAGYVQAPEIIERIEDYIVPPALGSRAGVIGALALAMADD